MLSTGSPLRLAFLGCGHIGKALLGAVLPTTSQPTSRISQITVSQHHKEAQSDLQRQFRDSLHKVNFVHQQNIEAVQNSEAVLLAFPPNRIHDVLGEAGMRESLKDKIVISILARTPREKIQSVFRRDQPHDDLRVVRAMPTIGASIHESATLIANPATESAAEREAVDFAADLFSNLGRVFRIPNDYFDAATGMSAATNALTTVAVQAIVQSSAAHGVPPEDAVGIASQCVRGTASIMLSGIDPDELEHSLSTPGSITEQAISGLKNGQLKGVLERVLSVAVAKSKDHTA
ncbi:hypothetical protein BDW62DRAFT_206836 [Aspergillus aurantiobrunneus]